ncbi:putative porin [Mucilaginibacter ginkgonis]|uniref:Putative porin n=1 Tax=Mucilaginibacter ginkgonis TaxID=2682091 RepID=A0A6I4HYK4_9SPHI|nr:putative porin [Mucilaginibacter ginkgonis]QQL51337.1 putative porin [Mucilaginibacter ginkgonis]
MLKKCSYLLVLLLTLTALRSVGQSTYPGTPPGTQPTNYGRDTVKSKPKLTDEQLMDTLRAKEDRKKDTVIFSAKFIRVTSERLLNDSTQVFPLDTTLRNFENYSPLYQVTSPRIGLGSVGLAQRPLLFEPPKTLGFDIGQHAYDPYLLTPNDILYYRARVGFTNLYLISGGKSEQIFKVIHSQNVKPNWNVGVNYSTIGSRGFYARQNVSNTNLAFFTWYESKNKRYNLLGNIIYNNHKAPVNGGVVNQAIFGSPDGTTTANALEKSAEPVKLNTASDAVISTGFYLKQFYYIGRLDNLRKGSDTSKVLPTNRVAYTLSYTSTQYKFLQNETDQYRVFPDYFYSATNSRDSLRINHLQNDFNYSFYLRGKSDSFVKNELKVDLGLTQDLYHYTQNVLDSVINQFGTKIPLSVKKGQNDFQNITLKARLGYRFSDRVGLDANLQQVAVGYNFGDYLYDARINLYGGSKAGRVFFEGYSQSNRAPLVFTNWISNHYNTVGYSFKNQKINNVAFNYINDKLRFNLKAEYFLISDYLYFTATNGGIDAHPAQEAGPISLLKISAGKDLTFGHWHFDNYAVYQKTDKQPLLRTPEVYAYTSLYYSKLLFNILNSSVGFNVRYNTKYLAPSYAAGLSQFYNGQDVTFNSYPIASVFFKATLIRTNIFAQYDYANQGLFSNGYYTVNRYPGQQSLFKFGVSWTFYN